MMSRIKYIPETCLEEINMAIKIQEFKDRIESEVNGFLAWLSLKKIIYSLLILIGIILLFIFRTDFYSYYCDFRDYAKNQLDQLDNINTIGFAFWFSTALLIVISLIKYFIFNTGTFKKDLGEFIMELPIDICTVVITILASLYLSMHTGKGITLIILTVGVITICAIFRRFSIRKGGLEDFSFLSAIFGILDVALAMFWIIQVLKLINS